MPATLQSPPAAGSTSSDPRADVRPLGPLGWGSLAFATLVAFVYAWTADPGAFIGDDGGITLRYAERVATGQGFNYSDGQAVNGASSPLWTLWLAGLLSLGLDAATAVRLSGALCFAVAGGLFGALGWSRGGAWLGALGAGIFWTREPNFMNAFGGLESGFTMVLIAATLLSVARGGRLMTGVCLGLAVASKLDGALLALGFTAASLLCARRFPVKEAAFALLTAAPMALILWLNFGSLLPQSAMTKVLEHATPGGFDWAWMPRRLWELDRWLVLGVPLLALVALLGRRLRLVEATAVLGFCAFLIAYMTIDLGDVYPWYLVAPFQCGLACCVLFAGAAADLWRERTGVALERLPQLAGVALLAVVLAKSVRALERRYDPLPEHGALPDHALHDLARLQAGAWLARYAEPGEILATFFGLPAFAYPGPVHDLTRLNSKSDPQAFADAKYFLIAGVPGTPENILRLPRVATFQVAAGGPEYHVHVRADSGVQANRALHFLLPLAPAAAGDRPQAVATAPNRVEVPAGGLYYQELELPALPELLFDASDPDAMQVQIAWAGPAGNPLQPQLVVVRVRAADPERSLVLENVRLRIGDPVRPEELKIRYERWDLRTGYLGERGFPEVAGSPATR
jgi:hypothetical protein